jgi:hypothetical protein
MHVSANLAPAANDGIGNTMVYRNYNCDIAIAFLPVVVVSHRGVPVPAATKRRRWPRTS